MKLISLCTYILLLNSCANSEEIELKNKLNSFYMHDHTSFDKMSFNIFGRNDCSMSINMYDGRTIYFSNERSEINILDSIGYISAKRLKDFCVKNQLGFYKCDGDFASGTYVDIVSTYQELKEQNEDFFSKSLNLKNNTVMCLSVMINPRPTVIDSLSNLFTIYNYQVDCYYFWEKKGDYINFDECW